MLWLVSQTHPTGMSTMAASSSSGILAHAELYAQMVLLVHSRPMVLSKFRVVGLLTFEISTASSSFPLHISHGPRRVVSSEELLPIKTTMPDLRNPPRSCMLQVNFYASRSWVTVRTHPNWTFSNPICCGYLGEKYYHVLNIIKSLV